LQVSLTHNVEATSRAAKKGSLITTSRREFPNFLFA
jgi:hypothetical protein